jgi:molecular chaperone HscB
MNHFGFYEIPLAFNIDESALRTRFYQLSKQYHPDFYSNQPEEKQQEMLHLSTLNNKAFKTLGSFEGRVKYILELHGMLEEGEKHALPPDFLMEMMDINEALSDLDDVPDPAKLQPITSQVDRFEEQINGELKKESLLFDETENEEERRSILERIKSAYHKSRYLWRLRETLSKFTPD